jgi:peptidoglycan/LPS O-acetylase OafA/YrhL
MSAPATYFYQLDALRGIACLMVLFHHLVPGASKYLALGPLGVRLFFVMTGFLMLGNLRRQSGRGRAPSQVFRSFYAKRAIRILPVYLLAFVVLLLTGSAIAKTVWPWIATFTLNLHMGLTGEWPGNLSHYWFLATSEQMVLGLALLILWLPGRYLVPALVLLFVGAWLHRWIGSACGLAPMLIWYSPLSSMDSIALGALLQIFTSSKPEALRALVHKPSVGVLAWLALLLAVGIRLRLSQTPLIHLAETFEALFFGWLILRAAIGFTGPWGKILTSPVLVYTGMISYALYIFHPLLHSLVIWGFQQCSLPSEPENPALIAATFLLSFLAATLSWYLMEKPLAALKPKPPALKP